LVGVPTRAAIGNYSPTITAENQAGSQTASFTMTVTP
jgi:hypothetical protein